MAEAQRAMDVLVRRRRADDWTHLVRTSMLRSICNPFEGCWPGLDGPITLAEVQAAIDGGCACLHAETAAGSVFDTLDRGGTLELRTEHVEKIAWFVTNGFQDAIELDVGVPALGCYVDWIVIDGNHRLAAAIFRLETRGEDPVVPCHVQGSEDYARELGLIM